MSYLGGPSVRHRGNFQFTTTPWAPASVNPAPAGRWFLVDYLTTPKELLYHRVWIHFKSGICMKNWRLQITPVFVDFKVNYFAIADAADLATGYGFFQNEMPKLTPDSAIIPLARHDHGSLIQNYEWSFSCEPGEQGGGGGGTYGMGSTFNFASPSGYIQAVGRYGSCFDIVCPAVSWSLWMEDGIASQHSLFWFMAVESFSLPPYQLHEAFQEAYP